MKTLKKFNEANYNREFKELEKIKVLLIEQTDLLESLKVKNIADLEDDILKSTGFKNIQASANLLGIENEYSRITEIEKIIDGRIKQTDLTTTKEFKKAFISKLKEKHSIYYTPAELNLLDKLKKVVIAYNELTIEERSQLAINRAGMQINPFSHLLR